MSEHREPTKEMCVGRRALEGLPGVALLQDWIWQEREQAWFLRVRLGPRLADSEPGLSATDWYVVVDEDYPLGDIKFYPSQDGGIHDTYPHQSINCPGTDGVPWRTGDLCLHTPERVLGRNAEDPEPSTVQGRLKWHFQRAIQWLQCASDGTLVRDGDLFELPYFARSGVGRDLIAFSEDTESFAMWSSIEDVSGLVHFYELKRKPQILVVKEFTKINGETLFSPVWGQVVSGREIAGIWVRSRQLPILPPWQAPRNWEEFRSISGGGEKNLFCELEQVLRKIRDGKPHPFLIGFPIPKMFGQPVVQMHWQGLMLPPLSYRGANNGFRRIEKSYRRRDRDRIFGDHVKIDWKPSQNWHSQEITARGRFPTSFRNMKIAIIGAGTIGSMLCEMLVRGGVNDLLVMDGDGIEAGNLVRHTLNVLHVHDFKVTKLVERLNRISPHARCQSIISYFPPATEEQRELLGQYDVVIDCTASNELLVDLKRFPWGREKRFVSISLGYEAQRIFCFAATGTSFPIEVFVELINPWLEQEPREYSSDRFPQEGTGCWHPFFPARIDDVSIMTCAALKHLVSIANAGEWEAQLAVFEQRTDNEGRFIGIGRAEPGAGDALS